MKISPGPWSTGTDEDSNIVYDDNLGFVAETTRDDGDGELEAGNAIAIAALPELLDALLLAQTHLLEALAIRTKLTGNATDGKLVRTCKTVAAAIAKARGEL